MFINLKYLHKSLIFSNEAIEELGIDTSNLPKGAKLIKRKDKDSGYDIWYVELIT
ncbi:MAG: hypothetical protein AUK64_2623, partial [bacterium P201]